MPETREKGESWPEPSEWMEVCVNSIENGLAIEKKIMELLSPCSAEFRHSVHLSLEEAFINAIRHGNVRLDTDGKKMKEVDDKTGDEVDMPDPKRHIRVAVSITREFLHVEIENECVVPFDPSTLPDPTKPENLEKPTGRGILLERAFTWRVRWNGGNHNNRISLEWPSGWELHSGYAEESEKQFVEDKPWLLDTLQDTLQEEKGSSSSTNGEVRHASAHARASLSSSLSTA